MEDVAANQSPSHATHASGPVDNVSEFSGGSGSGVSVGESIIYEDLIKHPGEAEEVLISDETTEGFALHARAAARMYGNSDTGILDEGHDSFDEESVHHDEDVVEKSLLIDDSEGDVDMEID